MARMQNDEERDLVRVGPGTPSGEVFRRYWLPVEASANLEAGDKYGSLNGPKNPLRLRVLDEELVLWRDGAGHPHLTDEHCAHRGTSLYYGRVEEGCIRCPYHAWAYDGTGQCIDQPAEPPTSRFKDTIRQTSYPCVEVGGLIFAYMGPAEMKPVFPRYDVLFREDGLRMTGTGSYVQKASVFQVMHDNNLDPWHSEFAHNWLRPTPTVLRMHHGVDGQPPTPLKQELTEWGSRDVALRNTDEPGVYEYYEMHTVWPTARCNRNALRWALPVDDGNTRWFVVEFYPYGPEGDLNEDSKKAISRRPQPNLADARFPEGWEDEVGAWWNFDHPYAGGLWEDEVIIGTQGRDDNGRFPDWERWNLASSDRGVLLNRRAWREQVERVRQGLDPAGVTRDPNDDPMIVIPAGRAVTDWEGGMRFFDMSVEERLADMERQGVTSGAQVYPL